MPKSRDFSAAMATARRPIGNYSSLVKALAQCTKQERDQIVDALNAPRAQIPDAQIRNALKAWGYNIHKEAISKWRMTYDDAMKDQLLSDIEAGRVGV